MPPGGSCGACWSTRAGGTAASWSWSTAGFPPPSCAPRAAPCSDDLPLHVREWTCRCGARHDRDVNAAKNHSGRRAGGARLWSRCQTCARGSARGQSSVKQEPSRVIGRIPVVHGRAVTRTEPGHRPPTASWGAPWDPAVRALERAPAAAAAVPQPAARALADLRVRRRVARGAARRDRHGAAQLRGLRAAVRAGHPGRRRRPAPAVVRLAGLAVVALPAHPGPARRARHGARPGGAGEAVVGRAEAVRVAAGPLARAGARTAVAAAARRRDPVRDRHRAAEHPVRLRVRLQLLRRPLRRRVGVPRRVRRARRAQAAAHGARAAVAVVARRAARPDLGDPPRGARRRPRPGARATRPRRP